MIIVLVDLKIKPGMRDELVQKAQSAIAQSRKEDGNITYNLLLNPENADNAFFVEQWKDKAATDFHNNTDHFKGLIGLLNEYVTEAPVIQSFETK